MNFFFLNFDSSNFLWFQSTTKFERWYFQNFILIPSFSFWSFALFTWISSRFLAKCTFLPMITDLYALHWSEPNGKYSCFGVKCHHQLYKKNDLKLGWLNHWAKFFCVIFCKIRLAFKWGLVTQIWRLSLIQLMMSIYAETSCDLWKNSRACTWLWHM